MLRNSRPASLSSVKAVTPNVVAMNAGYCDARAGLPFRAAYDTSSRSWQQHYERGRLMAVNVRAAGLRVPEWAEGTTGNGLCAHVYEVSKKRCGTPQPRAHAA